MTAWEISVRCWEKEPEESDSKSGPESRSHLPAAEGADTEGSGCSSAPQPHPASSHQGLGVLGMLPRSPPQLGAARTSALQTLPCSCRLPCHQGQFYAPSPRFSVAGKSQTGAEVLLPQCLLRRSTKFPVHN